MGAMFAFDTQGLLVSVDDSDNANQHNVLNHESGTMVSFSVWNVGDEAGTCQVDIEVDDNYVTSWTSPSVQPGQSAGPGFVRSIGRYDVGQHVFLIYLNPGAGTNDHVENRADVQ